MNLGDLEFKAEDFAGIQTGHGHEFLDENAASECAERAANKVARLVKENALLKERFDEGLVDWDVAKENLALKGENARLRALLLKCQERLDGSGASDELWIEINSALSPDVAHLGGCETHGVPVGERCGSCGKGKA